MWTEELKCLESELAELSSGMFCQRFGLGPLGGATLQGSVVQFVKRFSNVICMRPTAGCDAPKNIKFGFQFMQVGNFLIGAYDSHHFSVRCLALHSLKAGGPEVA